MGAFELPEPSHCGRTLAVHLRAVQVISLAVVASLGPQILDPRRASHHNPRVCALRLRSRAIWLGSVRLRNSPIEEIIVTDTVDQPLVKRLPNMTVLSVSLLLGEAISRIHTGESVSVVFGAPV